MNFINNSSINEPDMIDKLALKMRSNNIKPELEVFEPGMINKAKYMISKGIISENKPYFNILLGSLGTSVLSPLSLASFLNELPDSSVWSLAGIGKYQLDANVMSLSSGGNIRIGLEDNLYMDKSKTVFASNVKLVERIVKIVRLMNLTIATPEEARKMLEIKKQR